MVEGKSKTRSSPVSDVDEYLARVPDEARTVLEKLRKTIKAVAPKAVEVISYQIPIFKLNGQPLVGFAAFKDHCSFYPLNGSFVKAHEDELKQYDTSKGTIRFPINKPLSVAFVKRLVKARIRENETHSGK